MKRKVPQEFLIWQKDRAIGDEYSHLPLAKNPVCVRLPEDIDQWVRSQGTAWLRNLICNVYYAEHNE